MAQYLNLKISGMHCDACVRRVAAALEKVPGVGVGDVQVGSARIRIEDRSPDRDAIRAAVRKIGFEVQSEQEAS